MKLSTKTRYGTRALLDLALHCSGNIPVPLKEIARRQDISLNYLEQIITPLLAGGIISATRGAKGGILLAKPPDEINLKTVFELLEGPVTLQDCIVKNGTCKRSGACATQDLWSNLADAINNVLISTNLQDLVEQQERKIPAEVSFSI
jgi:Rrf2 family transcriptional regulator, cysteine metabolism repressor